jgi:hypothetical protein
MRDVGGCCCGGVQANNSSEVGKHMYNTVRCSCCKTKAKISDCPLQNSCKFFFSFFIGVFVRVGVCVCVLSGRRSGSENSGESGERMWGNKNGEQREKKNNNEKTKIILFCFVFKNTSPMSVFL